MARKGSGFLLFGGLLGAGLALLYAPYSGVKSRKKMFRFGKVMSKRSDKAFRNFSDMMSDWGDTFSSIGRKRSMLHW
jgi:gas vesicle protein